MSLLYHFSRTKLHVRVSKYALPREFIDYMYNYKIKTKNKKNKKMTCLFMNIKLQRKSGNNEHIFRQNNFFFYVFKLSLNQIKKMIGTEQHLVIL